MWPFTRRGRDKPPAHIFPLSLWGPRGDRSLEGSEGIFSAVTRLSNALASTPFHLYKGADIAQDNPLERLFGYQPAPGMTPFAYKNALEASRNTQGNGYALKVPDARGNVERLDVLDPYCVTPLRDEDTGEVWYRLNPRNGGEMYVHHMEMIHVRQVSTGGLKGVSPIHVLRDALDYDDQMQSFSLQQVKGVNSCVTLEFPSQLGGPQKEKVIEDFLGNYKKSAGNLIVLSGGAKSSVITKSPVDSKVMDVEKVTKGRIAAVYNMPPHMLGNFDHASYGSNEQQMLEFVQLTMQAIYQQYQDEHNLKLLTWEQRRAGYEFRFLADKLIIPTALQKAQAAQYYVRSGIKTPNEVRVADLNLTKHKDGDELMASRDLAPLGYLTQNPDKVKRSVY